MFTMHFLLFELLKEHYFFFENIGTQFMYSQCISLMESEIKINYAFDIVKHTYRKNVSSCDVSSMSVE